MGCAMGAMAETTKIANELRTDCRSAITLPEAPSHPFFDRQNVVTFAALGGLIALDSVQTQLMLQTHQFGEADPLARPFVNRGWPGQLAASTLGYGTVLSLAYILHRTNHRKMERCVTWFITSAEAANDTRNLLLEGRYQ